MDHYPFSPQDVPTKRWLEQNKLDQWSLVCSVLCCIVYAILWRRCKESVHKVFWAAVWDRESFHTSREKTYIHFNIEPSLLWVNLCILCFMKLRLIATQEYNISISKTTRLNPSSGVFSFAFLIPYQTSQCMKTCIYTSCIIVCIS